MPSEEQVRRFRRDLEALTGAAPARLGVAVSGGPDSLALLLLAHAAYPEAVAAATVDHRLRPESAAEAEFVARICAGLGAAHIVLRDEGAPAAGANAQARAREYRYRLLCDWAIACSVPVVATGHHADDQAETVLMRLGRGAGLAGLAGIRRSREERGVTIVRPLLGWRRQSLAAIVAEAGIAPVDDPSNRSQAYDRTRFRDLIEQNDLLRPERAAAAAGHLAEAEEALAWAADREWRVRVDRDADVLTLDPAGLPAELVRRLAARAVGEVRGGGAWRLDKLAGAIEAAACGGRATVGGVVISGGARWRFEPEPRRGGG